MVEKGLQKQILDPKHVCGNTLSSTSSIMPHENTSLFQLPRGNTSSVSKQERERDLGESKRDYGKNKCEKSWIFCYNKRGKLRRKQKRKQGVEYNAIKKRRKREAEESTGGETGQEVRYRRGEGGGGSIQGGHQTREANERHETVIHPLGQAPCKTTLLSNNN